MMSGSSGLIASALTSVLMTFVLIAVGLVVLFRLLGARGKASAAAMTDPVPGTLLVTAIGMPRRAAIYHMARLTGVISADGVEPVAVQHQGLIRQSQWPRPGQTLPVIVDRAHPRRFSIDWDQVQAGADAALDQAEALAAAMRSRNNGGSS